jgi:hypothetical protein
VHSFEVSQIAETKIDGGVVGRVASENEQRLDRTRIHRSRELADGGHMGRSNRIGFDGVTDGRSGRPENLVEHRGKGVHRWFLPWADENRAAALEFGQIGGEHFGKRPLTVGDLLAGLAGIAGCRRGQLDVMLGHQVVGDTGEHHRHPPRGRCNPMVGTNACQAVARLGNIESRPDSRFRMARRSELTREAQRRGVIE